MSETAVTVRDSRYDVLFEPVQLGRVHAKNRFFQVPHCNPVQARMMSASDIADLRRWHRLAVRRALAAGYDVIYVYSGHNLSVLHHFLSRRYNQRTDSYGGSVANRARLRRSPGRYAGGMRGPGRSRVSSWPGH